ncbi:hypothetical protein TNCV_2774131 [Trichonephila clavipes]|nr:hypothetical protein TNCV_2774131 [Trichonephila clavipes]
MAACAHMWLQRMGTMTGQRYIDEVLLPHVRLSMVLSALGREVAGRNCPPTNKNTLILWHSQRNGIQYPQQLLDNVVQSIVTTCGMLHHTPRVDISRTGLPFFKVPADF